MATTLEALLRLQSVERQLAQVRKRLRTRQHAVNAQQKKIDALQADVGAMTGQLTERRKQADARDLDLKTGEEHVARLRTQLNSAKTNKEYAAILTQINTLKADNAKIEDEILKSMQEFDALRAELEQVQGRIEVEGKRLEEVRAKNQEEIDRLNEMTNQLQAKRDAAAEEVPDEALAVFSRIAENYEGEAMAAIEVHGKKPPYTYVCGGCFMTLNAEHANILRTRDEVRTCDNCGRILYLEPEGEGARA